jgi:hypothetical protein
MFIEQLTIGTIITTNIVVGTDITIGGITTTEGLFGVKAAQFST